MAAKGHSIRFPDAVKALIEARAQRDGVSFSQAVLDSCVEANGGFAEEERPRQPKAKRPKPSASVQIAAPKRERDTSPRLAAAPTGADTGGKGGGMVSGLSLPVGNTRPPMQRARDRRT